MHYLPAILISPGSLSFWVLHLAVWLTGPCTLLVAELVVGLPSAALEAWLWLTAVGGPAERVHKGSLLASFPFCLYLPALLELTHSHPHHHLLLSSTKEGMEPMLFPLSLLE